MRELVLWPPYVGHGMYALIHINTIIILLLFLKITSHLRRIGLGSRGTPLSHRCGNLHRREV